uniref:Uncharacterized protein n=1 Tax=Sphaerodactylus townsendi TaxID=933632 RepID=A0ACB8EN24_9SAUR
MATGVIPGTGLCSITSQLAGSSWLRAYASRLHWHQGGALTCVMVNRQVAGEPRLKAAVKVLAIAVLSHAPCPAHPTHRLDVIQPDPDRGQFLLELPLSVTTLQNLLWRTCFHQRASDQGCGDRDPALWHLVLRRHAFVRSATELKA